MKSKVATAAVLSMLVTSMVPDAAMARRTYVHHGHSHRCRSGHGVIGTVVGGGAGAVAGNAIIGGPVATVAGGVGGALLGRHIDRKNVRRRHGC